MYKYSRYLKMVVVKDYLKNGLFGLELALLGWWRMILRIQKTITELNHRLESVMLANFSLQRWVKGSFSSSLHLFFSLARETPWACIFPGFIAQRSYQKCLLLLQPNFWWHMWRQESQFSVSFPMCRPANPLPFLCDVLSQPIVVWTGLCEQMQRLWTTPCNKKISV